MLKSGSDFREFSQITVTFGVDNDRPSVDVVKHTITRDIPPDPEIQAIVDNYLSKLEKGTPMLQQLNIAVCPYCLILIDLVILSITRVSCGGGGKGKGGYSPRNLAPPPPPKG